MQKSYKVKNSSDYFGKYTSCYGLVYQDKDYASEASFVSGLITKHCLKHGSARILDFACGIGRHAIELAQKGYEFEGSDISREMVEMAKKAAKLAGLKLHFMQNHFKTNHILYANAFHGEAFIFRADRQLQISKSPIWRKKFAPF